LFGIFQVLLDVRRHIYLNPFAMKNEITAILSKVIPNAFFTVTEYSAALDNGQNYLKINIAATDHEINSVKGQYPANVALLLCQDTLEVAPQVFGGNGGQSIFRKPNKQDPKEMYLALKSIRIPFRKPKREKKNVLLAIQRFADRWREAIEENVNQMPDYGFDWKNVIQK